MALDENNIEELFDENIEQMLEDMINDTFDKEFENIDSFDENISIEEAESQLEEAQAEISPEVYIEKTLADEEENLNNAHTEINIELPIYNTEDDTYDKSSEVTFKAGEIKGANNESFKKYISPENIEYANFYDESDEAYETNKDEDIIDDETETEFESVSENIKSSGALNKNNLQEENSNSIQTQPAKNLPNDSVSNLFKNISIDQTLPVNADDLYYSNNNNAKYQRKNNKNRSKSDIIKSNIVAIIIFFIVATGLIISFFDYDNIVATSNKTLVYELPTLSFSVFDEDGKTPHNVKLNVSVGVPAADMKLVDSAECYNIVYNTVSKMNYQYFASPNAQYELKKDIKTSLEEQDQDDLDYSVYISGIDVGKANLIGTTVDTKSDDENDKKESSEDMLNSIRYNADDD